MNGSDVGRRLLVLPPEGIDADEALALALDEVEASWSSAPDGAVTLWLRSRDETSAIAALADAGFTLVSSAEEEERDWVAEAARLQRPVAVGPFLLDPHGGPDASAAPGRTRLHLPAETAFGTGSHESTRLALRLLTALPLAGRSVLDVGCGAGTLAFVARLAGARRAVGFDLDPEAAFASRRNAVRNAVGGCAFLAGPIDAFRASPGGTFDVVVANMLEQEVLPILHALVELLPPGALLVTAGQLSAREAPFLAELRTAGLSPERLAAEGEWLGTLSRRV